MTDAVGTPIVESPDDQTVPLSGRRDSDADEYTVYPATSDDETLLTTWLTVDADAVVDVDDWR